MKQNTMCIRYEQSFHRRRGMMVNKYMKMLNDA